MFSITNIEEIANTLGKARKTNYGYQCCCPAHDDQNPSLTISLKEDKILVHCFAGCEQEIIIQALKARNLWPTNNKANKEQGKISYHYTDIKGNKVFTKIRMPGKKFHIEPAGNKNWVLYNLPGIKTAKDNDQPLFFTEGEDDADNLTKLGLYATCNPHGASESWKDYYTESLSGYNVIIIPDNDEPGKKHAQKVYKAILNKAKSVKILELPNLPIKGDVSDWLEAGGTKEELLKLIYELPEIENNKGLLLRKCSEIEMKPINWLWHGRMAKGKITLIAGNPGVGKSQIVLKIAAIVSKGGKFPVDNFQCTPGKVLVLSAEDDPSDTICPRLEASGADLKNISILENFNLKEDVEKLENTLKKEKDISLIIIDPVTAFLGNIDSHDNADVRSLMTIYSEIVAKYQVAMLFVSHLNKNSNLEAMMRVMGSIAFVAAARAVYIVTKDKNDEKRRLMLPLKNNIGIDNSGFAYTVKPYSINTDEGTIETSYIEFEQNAVEKSVDEAMQSSFLSSLDSAKEFLLEVLADGELSSNEILERGKQEGCSKPSLKRAKKLLSVKSVKKDGQWFWELPSQINKNQEDQGDQVLPLENLDPLDPLEIENSAKETNYFNVEK